MMTEKEIIKHAKDYIDSLANGTNPLTGEPVNESDVVNNVRIARCLFYVSGILEKVLNGERNILPRVKKSKFSISAEKLEDFEYSSEPILVSDVVKRIATLSESENMRKFPTSKITKWLLKNGFLEERENKLGKIKKYVTSAGEEIGLYQEEREGQYGRYVVTLYTTSAQHFVIDNLEAILAE